MGFIEKFMTKKPWGWKEFLISALLLNTVIKSGFIPVFIMGTMAPGVTLSPDTWVRIGNIFASAFEKMFLAGQKAEPIVGWILLGIIVLWVLLFIYELIRSIAQWAVKRKG